MAEALKLDRELLLGRPVFVSECVDKNVNPTKFKVSWDLTDQSLYY